MLRSEYYRRNIVLCKGSDTLENQLRHLQCGQQVWTFVKNADIRLVVFIICKFYLKRRLILQTNIEMLLVHVVKNVEKLCLNCDNWIKELV